MSTTATLESINHDGPVRVRNIGRNHTGLDWTVQPENFDTVIEMINKSGPQMWEITPL